MKLILWVIFLSSDRVIILQTLYVPEGHIAPCQGISLVETDGEIEQILKKDANAVAAATNIVIGQGTSHTETETEKETETETDEERETLTATALVKEKEMVVGTETGTVLEKTATGDASAATKSTSSMITKSSTKGSANA